MFRYNGLMVILKEVTSFDYFATKCGNTLLLYINRNFSNREKSRILHKAIKACVKLN